MNSKNHLIFALDVSDKETAYYWIEKLKNEVGYFKVGLELFIATGPNFIKELTQQNINIFLDLKLYDIPQTMKRTIRIINTLNPKILSIHIDPSGEGIKSIMSENPIPEIFCVSLLTSISSNNKKEINRIIKKNVAIAIDNGANGIICSPKEVKSIRKNFGNNIKIMTPGIRGFIDDNVSSNNNNKNIINNDDQKRTGTAYHSILHGSNYIVVGRLIKNSNCPLYTTRKILSEIEFALKKK